MECALTRTPFEHRAGTRDAAATEPDARGVEADDMGAPERLDATPPEAMGNWLCVGCEEEPSAAVAEAAVCCCCEPDPAILVLAMLEVGEAPKVLDADGSGLEDAEGPGEFEKETRGDAEAEGDGTSDTIRTRWFAESACGGESTRMM